MEQCGLVGGSNCGDGLRLLFRRVSQPRDHQIFFCHRGDVWRDGGGTGVAHLLAGAEKRERILARVLALPGGEIQNQFAIYAKDLHGIYRGGVDFDGGGVGVAVECFNPANARMHGQLSSINAID